MSAPFALDTLGVVASSGLENSFSPGLAVGLRLSRHVSAEVVGLFASTELALDPGVGGPLGFDTDVWLAAAGGRYLFVPAATVAPYAVAGAGVRHVRISVFGGEETDFMWNVGAGALFDTGWVADVRVEVRDHMSEFRDDGATDGRLQHDLWAGVGLEFGLM